MNFPLVLGDAMQCRFPQYLTKPFQVLWFEPDDLAVMTSSLIIANQFGGYLWLLLIVLPWGYSHLKRQYPRGFLRHLLYFVGIAPMKGYPTFFDSHFQE